MGVNKKPWKGVI